MRYKNMRYNKQFTIPWIIVAGWFLLSACSGGESGASFDNSVFVPSTQLQGVNAEIATMVLSPDELTLYIGGTFTRIAPASGSFVSLDANNAKINPVYPRIAGQVYTSVSDGNGGWFIGGDFKKVGDDSRQFAVHILADGSVDATWAPEFNSVINTMVVANNTLYVGG